MPGFGGVRLIPRRRADEVGAVTTVTFDVEQLILDGVPLFDPVFTLLGLEQHPPPKLIEWARSADRSGARLVRPPRHDLWEITARLRVNPQTTQDAALDILGTLIDKLQSCELRANTPSPVTMIYSPVNSDYQFEITVLAAEITTIPRAVDGDEAGWLYANPLFEIKFYCEPGAKGPQEASTVTVSGDQPWLDFEISGVSGDLPAEGTLVCFEGSGFARNFFEWGLEQRNYNGSAGVFIANADMATVGVAGSSTSVGGAYPTGMAISANLSFNPIVVTTPQADLLHVGKFRIKARVRPTTEDVQVRLGWRVGDAAFTHNPYVNPPGGALFWSEVDLGVVDIPPARFGTQVWNPRIEALAGTPGADLAVDYLVIVPVDNGYGKAKAGNTFETPTQVLSADHFDNHLDGDPLTGQSLTDGGGQWAAVGDATDFECDLDVQVLRVASSDTDVRIAYDDTTGPLTNVAVQCDQFFDLFPLPGATPSVVGGVVARFVDINNWFMAQRWLYVNSTFLVVAKRVGGVGAIITTSFEPFTAPIWTTIRLQIDDTGRWAVWYFARDFSSVGGIKTPAGDIKLSGYDPVLALGGALEEGGVGIGDFNPDADVVVRYYDNFFAFEPNPISAVYPAQSISVHDSDPVCVRQNGLVWGRPPTYRGQRFELPPAGDEGLTSHVVMKAHRNDIDVAPAEFVEDSITGVCVWRPRYSAIPRTTG